MSAETKPGYVWSVLNHKCPRCRTGDMFHVKNSYKLKQFMKMNVQCPQCGQFMEIEPGFYYGTSYVSYALTVGLSGFTFLLWWATIGLSLNDNRFFWWIGVNMVILVALQPYIMRLSRTLWLSFFVAYNPNWRTEAPEKHERQ